MKQEWSIASVTVTYNAANVVGKQLSALLRQNRRIDEIIVVDNGSRDGTLEMLRNQYPEVTVIDLKENLGIGGALAAGLSYAALKKKYDWTWIFDQDSVPETDALDRLIRGYSLSEEQRGSVGVLASLPKDAQNGVTYPGLLWRDRLVAPSFKTCRQRVWFVDATISSGTMICREVVEKVGLPRVDFFMDFVDFEYSVRIRRQGYEIAVVRDSVLYHTIGTPLVFEVLGYRKVWSDHVPWREYYTIRNHTYFVWHLYPRRKAKVFMLERLARHGMAALFLSKHRLQSFQMILRGFRDGRAGRLGMRFRDESPAVSKTKLGEPFHAAKSTTE